MVPLLSLGYAAVLEKISEAIAIADPGGLVRYHNAAFSRIFGSAGDLLIGADLLALVADDERALLFPVHHSDQTTAGFVAIIRDTREARRLENDARQTQTMEAVSRLASGVAHDFNNLLTVINGYAELALISSDMASPIFGPLIEIRKAGEEAAELTQRMLEVGRSQVLQPRVLEMNAVVRDLIAAVRPLLGGRIALVSSLDPAAGQIRVDPLQFRRALLNLVMRVKEAMPEGGSLLIQTEGPAASQDATVSITHTGMGLDEATTAHMFEPFFSAGQRGFGAGLELSALFGFVKQSGGHIHFSSEPGEGATFKMYFPTYELKPPVLIVDDEAPVRAVLAGILTSAGYEVHLATDGDEVFEAVRQRAPGIVITDLVMPRKDGIETIAEIRRLAPKAKIIAISGAFGGSLLNVATHLGASAALAKPIAADVLLRTVEDLWKVNGEWE